VFITPFFEKLVTVKNVGKMIDLLLLRVRGFTLYKSVCNFDLGRNFCALANKTALEHARPSFLCQAKEVVQAEILTTSHVNMSI